MKKHHRSLSGFCLFLLVCLLLPACSAGKAASLPSAKEPDQAENGQSEYIKWIDFDIPEPILTQAMRLDIETLDAERHVNWIELLALCAARSGGSFSACHKDDLQKLVTALQSGKTAADLTSNLKLYNYYLEAYGAVLGGMVGPYTMVSLSETGEMTTEAGYGLRAFSPIAAGYHYTDYDDFGAARSYGYKRNHLGHDLLGSVGTPVIAVESGYVEHLGWNQYGGWRVGIRSLDGKRYYYYAHLRKNSPFAEGLFEGAYVSAGQLIGYLGMTGYSVKENVNGINTPHLHYGLQIIFDSSQIDGWNQIWIDLYDLTRFLARNRAQVHTDDSGKKVSSRYCIYPEEPET